MGLYCKNRLLIISLALAGSGILTCGLAIADIFLPRGSTIVVLASIPLLGAVALGVLIAFAWTCELLDRRGGLRLPRRTVSKAKRISLASFLGNVRRRNNTYRAARLANDRLGVQRHL